MISIRKHALIRKQIHHLTSQNEISFDEIMIYNRKEMNWLIERGTICLDNTIIKLNKERVQILYELFHNNVICLQYIKNKVLDNLIKTGEIVVESKLLSRPESEYFNFVLNKSQFTNGLDLRNRYLHGTISSDEEVQQDDYVKLLKMFIILVIKINEEFCLNNRKECKS